MPSLWPCRESGDGYGVRQGQGQTEEIRIFDAVKCHQATTSDLLLGFVTILGPSHPGGSSRVVPCLFPSDHTLTGCIHMLHALVWTLFSRKPGGQL